MTILSNVKLELLDILKAKNKVIEKEKILKIVSKNKSEQNINQLRQLLYALKLGEIQFDLDFYEDKIRMTDTLVTGYIDIYIDDDGYLDKFFIIPETSKISDIDSFEIAIKKLNAKYDIAFLFKDKREERKSNSINNLAVASMAKIIIAGCIYKEIDDNNIDFETRIKIKNKNISVLSAGISKTDVGREINIKELLKNMLILSDNSAMDIFIDFLGKDKINKYLKTITCEEYHDELINSIELTKVIYGQAWCFDNQSEEIWRYRALTQVAWTKGLDYFIPLEIIGSTMQYILEHEWVPWDDLEIENDLIYKGGSAPGILSCIWSLRNSHKKSNLQFLFAINREKVFTLLEELYIFECANKLLQHYTNITSKN